MTTSHKARAVCGALILLLGGCRTYGAYNGTEETAQQVTEVSQSFAADLEVARGRLAAAERLPATPANQAYVATLRQIVDQHARQVALHQRWVAEARLHSGDYRAQQHTLGGMLMDQVAMRWRYEEAARMLAQAQDTVHTTPSYQVQDRYYVAPIFYAQLMDQGTTGPSPTAGASGMPAADTTAARPNAVVDTTRR